jgi:hypothetical protein
MWLSSDGRFHFRIGSNTKNSTQTLNPNQWYLLTGTFNSANKQMSLYIDGQFDSSASQSAGFNSPVDTKLTIGVRGTEDAEYFDGKIDEVCIFNYLLSPDEIQGLYSD